jgi:hypothetical protein
VLDDLELRHDSSLLMRQIGQQTALPQSVWRTILRTGRFRRDSDDFKEALVARERCFRSKR